MNFLAATAAAQDKLEVGGIEIGYNTRTRIEPGSKLLFGIRPEHFDVTDGTGLTAIVDVVERLGATSFVHATLHSGESVVAERRSSPPKVGDRIKLNFAPSAVRLFTEAGDRIR